jgi:hypothetical protein
MPLPAGPPFSCFKIYQIVFAATNRHQHKTLLSRVRLDIADGSQGGKQAASVGIPLTNQLVPVGDWMSAVIPGQIKYLVRFK